MTNLVGPETIDSIDYTRYIREYRYVIEQCASNGYESESDEPGIYGDGYQEDDEHHESASFRHEEKEWREEKWYQGQEYGDLEFPNVQEFFPGIHKII